MKFQWWFQVQEMRWEAGCISALAVCAGGLFHLLTLAERSSSEPEHSLSPILASHLRAVTAPLLLRAAPSPALGPRGCSSGSFLWLRAEPPGSTVMNPVLAVLYLPALGHFPYKRKTRLLRALSRHLLAVVASN